MRYSLPLSTVISSVTLFPTSTPYPIPNQLRKHFHLHSWHTGSSFTNPHGFIFLHLTHSNNGAADTLLNVGIALSFETLFNSGLPSPITTMPTTSLCSTALFTHADTYSCILTPLSAHTTFNLLCVPSSNRIFNSIWGKYTI